MPSIVYAAKRLLIGSLGAGLFVATMGAQSASILGPPSEANHFVETPKGWVHPKTAWGEPSLEGTWPIPAGINMVRTCPGRGGRGGPAPAPAPTIQCDPNNPPAWLSDEEWKARLAQADLLAKRGDAATQALAKGDFGAALQGGVTDPTTPLRQRSTIVDPPNGKLPELTPEGKRRSALMKSSWALQGEVGQTWDHWEDFDSWDRCITRGMPSSMMAYRYNNGIKIFQAPGMVVLSLEMIHEDRIIYTDGRKPLPGAFKHYMGEPRGRWEGNTLVVETTNYREGPSGTNIGVYGAPAGNRWPVSDQMKTVERFTRLNDDYILYESTTTDPVVMTRGYTVRYPLKRDEGYEWWEYACHEGNTIVQNYSTTSQHERTNPPAEPPARRAQVSAEIAGALAGKWTGRPRHATVDYNIFLEFTRNADGTVQGTLIGTDLETFGGKVPATINKPLRELTIKDRVLNFEFPNTQPWTFAGELSADGTALTGTVNSAQGGMPITFRKS
jgi:hypothetical protein